MIGQGLSLLRLEVRSLVRQCDHHPHHDDGKDGSHAYTPPKQSSAAHPVIRNTTRTRSFRTRHADALVPLSSSLNHQRMKSLALAVAGGVICAKAVSAQIIGDEGPSQLNVVCPVPSRYHECTLTFLLLRSCSWWRAYRYMWSSLA